MRADSAASGIGGKVPASAPVIQEAPTIIRFDAQDLAVCQHREFPFPTAAGQPASVLMQEPEQKVRQPLWHIDHQIQPNTKPVIAPQECGFLRQIAFDGLLHTAVQEFGLRRGIEEPVSVAGIGRLPVHDRQQPLRMVFECSAILPDPLQNGCRYREDDAGRVETAPGEGMVNKVAVQPAVTVLKGVGIDKAEGENRRGHHRIELCCNHAFDEPGQVLRASADMVGDRHARLAIPFSSETALAAQSKTDETGIADHDALQAQ